MSIASIVRTAGPFAGTGSLVALPFAFKVFAASDLVVQRTSTSGAVTTLTLTTHYSVSLNADQDTSPGGTVTLVTALASGETAMVTSNVAATQPLQLASGGPFLPQQIEDALDRTMIIVQQQGVLGDQTLRLPLGQSVPELPALPSLEGRVLGVIDGRVVGLDPSSPSAVVLEANLASTADGKGASLVGFLQFGTGAVPRTVQSALRDAVRVQDFGAVGDGVTNDAAAIQAAITAFPTRAIEITGTFALSAGLDLSGFSGLIFGEGTLVAKAGVSIFALVSATSATGFAWDGVSIDMGQISSTTAANARCRNGIYIKDCRKLRFSNFSIYNVAADDDRLIYVDGTSSNAPAAGNGSQNITFDNVSGEAFYSGVVDIGPQVLIRSDFYMGDNGGTCILSTNGTKLIDYSEDATVSFGRTTQNIQFNNCRFKYLDRFSFLNCKDVYISNTILDSFNTRGFVGTYTCENINISNCEISGNAASLIFNYACKNINATNLISRGPVDLLGQRSTFVFGAGVKHVRITNVTGFGHDISALLIQGAYDVTLNGVTMRNPAGTTINVAVEIDGGLAGNTASGWVTDRIALVNCEFECRYGFQFNAVTGSATIAKGAVTVLNSHFKNTTALFNGTVPTNSEIAWASGKVDVASMIAASAFSYGALGALGALAAGTNEIFPTSGSWTPVLAGSSVAGSNTLTNVDARWWRIGNLVYIEGDFTLSVKDAAMAGNLEIRGLPFAAATRANAVTTVSFGYMSGVTLSGGYATLTGLISSGTSAISFRKNATALAGAPVPVGDIAAGAILIFSGCYLLA